MAVGEKLVCEQSWIEGSGGVGYYFIGLIVAVLFSSVYMYPSNYSRYLQSWMSSNIAACYRILWFFVRS